jgi:hypothetical protein
VLAAWRKWFSEVHGEMIVSYRSAELENRRLVDKLFHLSKDLNDLTSQSDALSALLTQKHLNR